MAIDKKLWSLRLNILSVLLNGILFIILLIMALLGCASTHKDIIIDSHYAPSKISKPVLIDYPGLKDIYRYQPVMDKKEVSYPLPKYNNYSNFDKPKKYQLYNEVESYP